MNDFIKELFTGLGEKIRTPQVLGSVSILILFFKLLFTTQFKDLYFILLKGIGRFGFVINVFQLLAVMLFLASIIVFLAAVFFTITYFVVVFITSESKKDLPQWIHDLDETMHRFFIGAKIATMKINSWFLIASIYFYVLDDINFNRYGVFILKFFTKSNLFIKVLCTIYAIVLLFSALELIKGMLYKFLYFRLDDETEKKLYEVRQKYTV